MLTSCNNDSNPIPSSWWFESHTSHHLQIYWPQKFCLLVVDGRETDIWHESLAETCPHKAPKHQRPINDIWRVKTVWIWSGYPHDTYTRHTRTTRNANPCYAYPEFSSPGTKCGQLPLTWTAMFLSQLAQYSDDIYEATSQAKMEDSFGFCRVFY